jgi:glucokinase
MQEIYIGMDWGGTTMKIGFFDAAGNLLAKDKIDGAELSSPKKFFPCVRAYIEKKVVELGFTFSNVAGAGIGVPGLLNVTEGKIYYLPNIKGWDDFAFKKEFERQVGVDLVMDNDANVASLVEFKRGAGVGCKRGIVLTVGTGLGSGLFLDGKLYTGDCSSAEAGHMPFGLEGKECGCSSHGCIETYVGSKHLVAKAKEFMKKEKSVLSVLKEITPEEIYKAAVKKDKVALKVWEYLGFVLGRFSAGLVNLLDLQVIVVGGGVSGAFKFFAPVMRETIKKTAMRPLGAKVKVAKAEYSNDAGIFGAYELIKEVQNKKRVLSEYQHILAKHSNAS